MFQKNDNLNEKLQIILKILKRRKEQHPVYTNQ